MKDDTEERILAAAADLLERGGPAALTTRAVCDAAGVKSPTLYHHFGDKEGLSAALVRRGMAQFMARKRAAPLTDDPLQQLRSGWDEAVEFALRRPALHALYAAQLRHSPELAAEAYGVMRARVLRLVDRGVFRADVDDAARAVWAACNGVLSLASQGVAEREIRSTSELLFTAVVSRLRQAAPD